MLKKEIISQLTTSTFQIGVHNIDISVPSCSCHNFILLNMPCKHIFALKCNNLLSWDELPHTYRNRRPLHSMMIFAFHKANTNRR